MNLRLRRLVRTSSSEQYALFDLDQVEDGSGAPATIGKLDLHFTGEGLYGTLLLWDEETSKLADEQREEMVYALLDELSMPMGVPNEYVVEFFAPDLDNYSVFHNVGLADETEDDDEDDSAMTGEEDDLGNEDRLAPPTPSKGPEVLAKGAKDQGDPEKRLVNQPLGEPLPDFDVKPVD
ncbi:MAG: hypothetical protein ACK2UO_16635 [Caldilineaceae bacterium]